VFISANAALRRATLLAVALLLAGGGAFADQPSGGGTPDPTGEWMVAKRYATIRIANCDGRLWGVVASETQPSVDSKNPDPKLRTRPTLGMPILIAMTRTKFNQWDGEIYNSQDGHTYAASVSMVNPNVLRVEGCFLGFLCGGEDWTRVEPQDQPSSSTGLNVSPTGQRQLSGANRPNPAEYVCLSVFGPSWLTHQRGLK
jgi:uncharacterized protein (DUF2147 family)